MKESFQKGPFLISFSIVVRIINDFILVCFFLWDVFQLPTMSSFSSRNHILSCSAKFTNVFEKCKFLGLLTFGRLQTAD